MKYRVLLLCLCGLLAACRQDSAKDKGQLDTPAGDPSIADIVRNPVSANAPTDTVNIAKITFDDDTHDFGEVDEGALVRHTYRFTNTGSVPLLISDARATCGCTVPTWPQKPIPPGGKGQIDVEFNTTGKPEQQHKPITITANTYPAATQLNLRGYVRPSGKASPSEQQQ